MITKNEIRKTLSEIKTLDKAFHICIIDDDLKDGLALKMADKMTTLIDRILTERTVSEWATDDLIEAQRDIQSHIKEEDDEKSIYFDECYKMTATIRTTITQVEVFILEK